MLPPRSPMLPSLWPHLPLPDLQTVLPQSLCPCLPSSWCTSLALAGLRLLAYKMGVTALSPIGLIAVNWGRRAVEACCTVVSSVRPAKAGFLFLPHPDLQLDHVPVDPQMTRWPGFLGSRVLEGLVAAWSHTGRQGSTPGHSGPTHTAQPQTHCAQFSHRPAEPAPPRRHPGDPGPPEPIRQVSV